jgi:hypothetical protein
MSLSESTECRLASPHKGNLPQHLVHSRHVQLGGQDSQIRRRKRKDSLCHQRTDQKSTQQPEGHFRATFDVRHRLLTGVVYPVRPHKFYNPAVNLLDVPPSSAGGGETKEDVAAIEGWQGMRLTGRVRASLNLPTPQQKDS